MKHFGFLLLVGLSMFIVSSCNKDDETVEPTTHDVNDMSDLQVDVNFNFNTSKQVNVTFSDNRQFTGSQVKFDIYLYSESEETESVTYLSESGETVNAIIPVFDMQNNKVASVITSENTFDLNLTVPIYYTQLYVVRNEMGIYSTSIIDIDQDRAAYVRAPVTRSANGIVDIFYAVNSLGDVLTINQSTGEIAKITDIPNNDGSWACAIDPETSKMYTIACKGSNILYSYDIVNNTWETIASIGISGPRLGYNVSDGLLYFSTSRYVYTIDPSNGNILSSYIINGLQTTSGGDLTFAQDGTMYISSTTGLYRCEFTDENTINTTWISSESLPNYPNSLTFQTSGQLWWATNLSSTTNNKGRVFIMDTGTGAWEERFSPYDFYIHDLATLPYDEAAIPDIDSDGDGITDFYDEYPDDSNKASTTYTPSMFGWGTYGFEDLWPYKGDYDFNDLVVNYRYTNILNSEGLLVETILNFDVKNVGGSYKNGFGIELDMPESLISSVIGYNLTEGIISLDAKGLELNQTKPVIIVFDNAWENYEPNSTLELVIEYTSAIDASNFGNLNPFIFIDKQRGREVHLSNRAPTSLVDQSLLGTGDDNTVVSNSVYYKDSNNLPWAIDIIHDFVFPLEKKEIIQGYPYFSNWAESSGIEYSDWYKDKDGYRNNNYLKTN